MKKTICLLLTALLLCALLGSNGGYLLYRGLRRLRLFAAGGQDCRCSQQQADQQHTRKLLFHSSFSLLLRGRQCFR